MRSVTRFRDGVVLALLVAGVGCDPGAGTGLLELSISAEATVPAGAANQIVLVFPGVPDRTYEGGFPRADRAPLVLQFPNLPAGEVIIAVRALAANGCLVAEGNKSATVKGGAKISADIVLARSGGACADGGTRVDTGSLDSSGDQRIVDAPLGETGAPWDGPPLDTRRVDAPGEAGSLPTDATDTPLGAGGAGGSDGPGTDDSAGGGTSGGGGIATGGAPGGGGAIGPDGAAGADAGGDSALGSTGGSGTGGSGTGGAGTGGAGTGGTGTGGTPPVTTIATHPANPTNDQTGDFTFTNSSAGVTYKCRIDTGTYVTCTASYTTPALADGSHTLTVQATDSGGVAEANPPSYTWVIDTVPPNTAISTHPASPALASASSFTFSATGETLAVTYECKLDSGGFTECPASYVAPALANGVHTLSVRAKDAAGNTDATPATHTWEVVPATAGCGKTPTLPDSTSTTPNYITITSGGVSRRYALRYPSGYNNTRPYPLVLAYHWMSASAVEVLGGAFFGLWNQANGGAIFIAPDGLNQGWANSQGQDLVFTDDILSQVKSHFCVDESRIFANGFSYGGGMAYALACDRANVFRAVAVHSGGQLSGCKDGTLPIAYYASHGLSDATLPISSGRALRDHFAQVNGCAAQSPPEPVTNSGTHICTTYSGCSAGHPVRWCAFDGDHAYAPTDAGQTTPWNPAEVWAFFTQF